MTDRQPERNDPTHVPWIPVWPKAGIEVRDEFTHELIQPGQKVPYTRLTIRRISDGDLLTKDPATANAKAERFGDRG